MKKWLFILCAMKLAAADQSGWFVDGAYTYWWAGQGGMEIGRSGTFISGDDPLYNETTALLFQPSEFRSGFEVGTGWRQNGWTMAANYTWVRNSTLQNSEPPPTSFGDLGFAVWLVAPWFLQEAGDGGSLSGTFVASKWQLKMDIGDVTVAYAISESKYLKVIPFGGLRTAWIRQAMSVKIIEPLGLFTPEPTGEVHSITQSDTWSIGPRFGGEVHAGMGGGCRIEGDMALSLLYTNLSNLTHSEDFIEFVSGTFTPHIKIKNVSQMTPVLEAGLGFGWKSGLQPGKYTIDLSFDYDFQLWWDQNFMRRTLDQVWREISSNGNLYLQGLTARLRLDF